MAWKEDEDHGLRRQQLRSDLLPRDSGRYLRAAPLRAGDRALVHPPGRGTPHRQLDSDGLLATLTGLVLAVVAVSACGISRGHHPDFVELRAAGFSYGVRTGAQVR